MGAHMRRDGSLQEKKHQIKKKPPCIEEEFSCRIPLIQSKSQPSLVEFRISKANEKLEGGWDVGLGEMGAGGPEMHGQSALPQRRECGSRMRREGGRAACNV